MKWIECTDISGLEVMQWINLERVRKISITAHVIEGKYQYIVNDFSTNGDHYILGCFDSVTETREFVKELFKS